MPSTAWATDRCCDRGCLRAGRCCFRGGRCGGWLHCCTGAGGKQAEGEADTVEAEADADAAWATAGDRGC